MSLAPQPFACLSEGINEGGLGFLIPGRLDKGIPAWGPKLRAMHSYYPLGRSVPLGLSIIAVVPEIVVFEDPSPIYLDRPPGIYYGDQAIGHQAVDDGVPMTIRERLEEDIRVAMRGRNQERLDALRFIKSQIQLAEKNQLKELDELGVTEVIARQAKERRESIQMFQEGNRSDLAAKESAALAVVEEYLPPQMGREELEKLVEAAIQQVEATSARDKGKVMGRLMPQVRGKADGALVNSVVTELLERGEHR